MQSLYGTYTTLIVDRVQKTFYSFRAISAFMTSYVAMSKLLEYYSELKKKDKALLL